MQEKTYYVKGMHCAACEVLIEKKLLEIPGVKSVQASTDKGRALVEYDGQQLRFSIGGRSAVCSSYSQLY